MYNLLIGRDVRDLPTPCLVLEAEVFERNLRRMHELTTRHGIALRPHVKSHKCPTIAHKQLQAGAIGVCTATLGEAEIMAYAGIDHIFLANEVVGQQNVVRLAHLCRGRDVMVAVDSQSSVRELAEAGRALDVQIGIIADLDVGMNRCGVKTVQELQALAQAVMEEKSLRFMGVMGYEGHAALVPEGPKRHELASAASGMLVDAVRQLEKAGIPVTHVTGGGTGTYQTYLQMKGVTEIEAGSYIFMDDTYSRNLSNTDFQQALFVLGTVISRSGRDVVINVGLKAASPERSAPVLHGHETMSVTFVQEEHLKGRFPETCPFAVGDAVRMVPSHCCTTVNLYDVIFVVRNGIVEAAWPVSARRA